MNHYLTVYSTVFAVMFNVMVFISYELGAFKVPSVRRILGFAVAVLLGVLAPVLFFVYALTVIEKVSDPLSPMNLLWVLYWVTPVYGFQQFWLLIAWRAGWADFGDHVPRKDWIWWVVALVAFGLIPAWRLGRTL